MIYVLASLCIIFDIFYIVLKAKHSFYLGLVSKCLAALCFITIGIINAKNNPNNFSYIICFGLLLDGLGDLFLALRNIKLDKVFFLIGAICFLLGHLTYIVGLLIICTQHRILYTLLGVLFGVVIYCFVTKKCEFSKVFKYVGIMYCLTISIMCFFAIGTYINIHTLESLVFMIGAIMFIISDIILIFCNFSNPKKWMHPVYSILYFSAQLLISLSLGVR